ncbi:ran-binding protein 3 isoform X1 [Ceratitis capitata]|uniref:ran-binding protein 3 isoform X1 n=1 Tax=Ceratitis capitata TaxID=7213 RepID=UPI000329EC22|nr:ran-binding protein 3 isoform X1 [Ceratitis capitata]
MSENNDTSNESNSLGSDSILQASRLTGGGVNPIVRSGVLRPSVLGPSVLGAAALGNGNNNSLANANANAISNSTATSNNVESNEEDSVSSTTNNNPFMREEKDEEVEESVNNEAIAEEGAVGGEVSNDNKASEDKKTADDDETDERVNPLSMLRKNGLERANLFAAAKNSIPLVEKSGFVFGQNVHERVVGENINTDGAARSENNDACSSTSGELLFSSVIQNAAKAGENDKGAISKDSETKTLTDVAREYEESRAQKRKYEEVETFTGEENEVNIVDVNCKLFAFVNSNWEERGRGSMRLNDSKNQQECSRVVFRTSGNLRLLLNTKVWAGMVAERPSNKSLRLTAMDNTGKIKIFLVMGRPADMSLLHKELLERIELRKASHPEECRAPAETKNGIDSTSQHEEESKEAKATAVPDHEESTEPSPKKPMVKESSN